MGIWEMTEHSKDLLKCHSRIFNSDFLEGVGGHFREMPFPYEIKFLMVALLKRVMRRIQL